MTDVQVPQQVIEPAARPRRRRRAVAVVVVGALVAAAVTAGVVTGVVGPSRLVEGSSWGVRVYVAPPPLGGADGTVVDDAVTDVSNVYGTEDRVDVQDGRWLGLDVPFLNDSPVPVRITGVSTPLETYGGTQVLDDVEVTVPVQELSPDPSWRPLGDGLVVPPGVSWRVRVVGCFDTDCSSPLTSIDAGGGITTDQLVDVDYEVFGVDRHASPPVSWTQPGGERPPRRQVLRDLAQHGVQPRQR